MKILAQQRIPKIDEMTANLSVILRDNEDGTYSTHLRNDDSEGLIHGNYRQTLPDAWADFGQRVQRYWPTINGVQVAPDATIESVRRNG